LSTVVNQVKGSEPSTTNHAVTHEIHAPALIDLLLFYQRLFNS
jgi:hypothetical protein